MAASKHADDQVRTLPAVAVASSGGTIVIDQCELRCAMREPTYYFLDTEWADAKGTVLVSLALVSEDGQHVFYAERSHLPVEATEFVHRVVYPLLERGEAVLPDTELTATLRRFLSRAKAPSILADHPSDLRLLKHALAGFDRTDVAVANRGPLPEPVMTCMDRDGLTNMLLEDWFLSHPKEAAKRHHALVDAQALRMAWLAATRRIRADWARLDYSVPRTR